MTNIGVVILNYMSYDVTIKCVEYFQRQSKDNINVKIVIVDNASSNSSFNILYNRFKFYEDVKVVKTPQNLGFAKGNNFGYKELCRIMKPDFVVVSNSDAYVKDDGLYTWIIDSYKEYKFGVLGPAIYSVRGKFYQSPMKNRSRKKIKIRAEQVKLGYQILKDETKKIINYNSVGFSDLNITWDNPFYKNVSLDKTLHGAFQIFSKDYFKLYSTPYDGRTFLYVEEDILRARCDLKDLVMLYLPSYTVYHLQAMSSNQVDTSLYRKKIIRNKNILHSLNVYLYYCNLLNKK